MVESFREAKDKLSIEELSAVELQVKGIGKFKLTNFFIQMRYAKVWTKQRIVFGGATLIKRYGEGLFQGVRFKFYDKVEGKPVSLYISQTMMKEYRHRKYIDSILSKANEVRYFTVYAHGHFEAAENENHGINLVVSHLRHLAIVLGPAKT